MNKPGMISAAAIGMLAISIWVLTPAPTAKLNKNPSNLSESHTKPEPAATVKTSESVQSANKHQGINENSAKPVIFKHNEPEPEAAVIDRVGTPEGEDINNPASSAVLTPWHHTDDPTFDREAEDQQHTVSEDQDKHENRVAVLQAQLQSEAYDSTWASTQEQELVNQFYELSPEGNLLSDAICRSTFCRIDITHINAEAELQFLAEFATKKAFINDEKQGFYQRMEDENGSARTVFFFARKGHQLPVRKL